MGYPTTLSLFLMLRLITSPIIMWSRRDKEHSCLTLLDKEKGVERKPLLEIIDSVFWYSFLMNFTKISDYPNFRIIWYKNFLSTLSNAFSWSIEIKKELIFLVLLGLITSSIVKRFENMEWLGIPQIYSIEIVCSKVVFSLFDKILVNIL